jgi:hypothetical protein
MSQWLSGTDLCVSTPSFLLFPLPSYSHESTETGLEDHLGHSSCPGPGYSETASDGTEYIDEYTQIVSVLKFEAYVKAAREAG